MSDKKTSWDDIPSLNGLSVDWEFEPENPEGKRAHKRMMEGELCPVLNMRTIPIKMVTKNFEATGFLVDLTHAGSAICLPKTIAPNVPVKIGFFLGEQKIVSNAVVKHVKKIGNKFKVGLAFVNLTAEYKDFIVGLSASKISEF